MPPQNLKEFNNEWILFGLLFFCLMTFTVLFMNNNSSEGLGEYSGGFDSYTSNMESNLLSIEEDSNSLLNITSKSNPEVSDLGSRDSVATSFGIFGSAKQFFSSIKLFLSWMLTGTSGKTLIAVFVGMFGFSALYFITKWIRQGG